MKKIIILAAAALATLASCSKVDVKTPDMQKEISFRAFNYKAQNTKAPIEGTIYKLTDPNFGMFAYWYDGTTVTSWDAAGATAFMEDVEIVPNTTLNIWEPEATYYWPLSGAITFIGYSPKNDDVDASYTNTTKTLTISEFDALNDYDLMYGEIAADKTANDTDYKHENGTTTNPKGVDVKFHHALSQIQFYVKSDYDIFKVNSIVVKGAKNGETLTVVNNVPSWTAAGTAADVTVGETETAVTAAYAQYGDSKLLIPQNLTGVTVEINYSQTANGITSTTTKAFSASSAAFSAWEINKKYIYYIDITANKIYFAPEIVDWDATTVNESYIYLNATKAGVINATTSLAEAMAGATVTCDGTIVTAASLNAAGDLVTYTVAPNSGAAREGKITIAGTKTLNIIVTQD